MFGKYRNWIVTLKSSEVHHLEPKLIVLLDNVYVPENGIHQFGVDF